MHELTKTSLKARVPTPKRIGSSIKKDAIHPRDYNAYTLPYACEDCSHFKAENESCTLGLMTEPHLRRTQVRSYEISGKIALCRFQEID
ncbi:MAG: hypothetical protein H7061_04990 [Bdellovibrionaceae bacterium]|nr:hypothetical protein [Bdellovibrio sp.]